MIKSKQNNSKNVTVNSSKKVVKKVAKKTTKVLKKNDVKNGDVYRTNITEELGLDLTNVFDLHQKLSLTKERIDILNRGIDYIDEFRDEASLIHLISWCRDVLDVPHTYRTLLNNRIIVDGKFFAYCESLGAKIETKVGDTIASWPKTIDHLGQERVFEYFMATGLFKVSYDGFEFYQGSIMHKGNQYDDEVTYFVIIDGEHIEKYIEFRNNYSEWARKLDSAFSGIRVIGGTDIPYSNEFSWDDIVIPDELKEEVRVGVESFLDTRERMKGENIPWKRGMIFYGEPGCGKTLAIRILISQYGFKPVTISGSCSDKNGALAEAFEYAEKNGPSLLFLEDLPELINDINISNFLNLLDGMNTREGILVIATANDINKIPRNIMDRPSRFDRKIQFPLPNKESTIKYLKDKFGSSLTKAKYDSVAEICVKSRFSFAHLKELYISSLHYSVADSRSKPNLQDLDKALKVLVNDKKDVMRGFGLGSKSIDILRSNRPEFF